MFPESRTNLRNKRIEKLFRNFGHNFFYRSVFVWPFVLSNFDVFEHHICKVVHYNEAFRMIFKKMVKNARDCTIYNFIKKFNFTKLTFATQK